MARLGVSFTEKKAAAPWDVGTFASHSQPLPCTAGLSLHLQFPTGAHGQRHRERVSSLCPTCPCPPTSLQPLLHYFPCLASSAATSKSWSIFIRNLPKGVLKYHSLGAEGLVHDLERLILPIPFLPRSLPSTSIMCFPLKQSTAALTSVLLPENPIALGFGKEC